jgi:hypothetical protein
MKPQKNSKNDNFSIFCKTGTTEDQPAELSRKDTDAILTLLPICVANCLPYLP